MKMYASAPRAVRDAILSHGRLWATVAPEWISPPPLGKRGSREPPAYRLRYISVYRTAHAEAAWRGARSTPGLSPVPLGSARPTVRGTEHPDRGVLADGDGGPSLGLFVLAGEEFIARRRTCFAPLVHGGFVFRGIRKPLCRRTGRPQSRMQAARRGLNPPGASARLSGNVTTSPRSTPARRGARCLRGRRTRWRAPPRFRP